MSSITPLLKTTLFLFEQTCCDQFPNYFTKIISPFTSLAKTTARGNREWDWGETRGKIHARLASSHLGWFRFASVDFNRKIDDCFAVWTKFGIEVDFENTWKWNYYLNHFSVHVTVTFSCVIFFFRFFGIQISSASFSWSKTFRTHTEEGQCLLWFPCSLLLLVNSILQLWFDVIYYTFQHLSLQMKW